MKLCAIYCVWDDFELLEHSVNNIRPLVDGVIISFSTKSNSGEYKEGLDGSFFKWPLGCPIFPVQKEPDLSLTPRQNETNKRNFGLQKARELGYTHFIMMDADEFYEPTEFLKAKDHILKNDLAATVCRLKCYFKEPTLTVPDSTLVTFITKITPSLRFEMNFKMPFAWEGAKRDIRIDPTRQLNITSGVEMVDVTMHHMSWIRSDVKNKIRNSTARINLENSTILQDYLHAKAGYYCEFYKAKLEACDNLFNIPRIVDEGFNTQDKT